MYIKKHGSEGLADFLILLSFLPPVSSRVSHSAPASTQDAFGRCCIRTLPPGVWYAKPMSHHNSYSYEEA